MSIESGTDAVQATTRTSQIIVGALIQGVVLFMAIVLLLLDQPSRPPGEGRAAAAPVITYLAVALGASLLVASFVVPKLVVDSGLRGFVKTGASAANITGDDGSKQVKPAVAAQELLPLFQTQLIIAAALAEGGAFFATIAYMLEHHYLALAVAGALLAALVSRFPTVDRVNVWLEENLSRLNEMRNAGW